MEGLEPSIFRFGDENSTLELHSHFPNKKALANPQDKNLENLQGPSNGGATLIHLLKQKISP